MKNKNNENKEADEILGCFKGKCATILFKKIVKDGFDRDVPLITIFKKRKELKSQRTTNKISVEYDEFYEELHIKKETKRGIEFITQHMDDMVVVNEKKFFIARKGGG